MIAFSLPLRGAPIPAPPVALAVEGLVRLPLARPASRAGSLAALVLSFGLHAAPLAALAYGWRASPPVSVGEEVIELDMIIAEDPVTPAPITEATQEPPDPNAVAPSVEAAQAPDKKVEEPREREEAAELRLPEEKPEPKLQKAEEKLVSVASAAPPAAASDESHAARNASYRARIAKHLARFKRFPAGARQGAGAGKVTLAFALDAEGRVESVALVASSGSGVFDAEALAMIRRAEPFPKPPESAREARSFVIPVAYALRD